MSLHLFEGAVIAGRFRLVRPIGRGGMGEVWLAHHLALDALCAVKFISAEAASSPKLRARFEIEAKSAAKIRSAHVVHILDFGLSGGRPYLAMEYLEGEDLRQRLDRVGKLDAPATARIVDHAALGLEQARRVGVVHRDLKPANLFLCQEDAQEIVKVLDFGIAKLTGGYLGNASGNLTVAGALVGTLPYMSPEQVQGMSAVDRRSDLWALGVIAFRCLTGRLPFKCEADIDTMLKILSEPIPVPSRIAPVPAGFDAWWAKASARDPDRRFQSARELSEALKRALEPSDVIEIEEIEIEEIEEDDPDSDDPVTKVQSFGVGMTVRIMGVPAAPSPPPSAGPITQRMPPEPARSVPSHSETPSPVVGESITPVPLPLAKRHHQTRAMAAVALVAIGGLAVAYVVPGSAVDATRAQAVPDRSAWVAAPAIVPPAVTVIAAETPSAEMPSAVTPRPPASSATVEPLSPASTATSSARPHLPAPVPKDKTKPARKHTFDPGI